MKIPSIVVVVVVLNIHDIQHNFDGYETHSSLLCEAGKVLGIFLLKIFN
jgi:hypothetical protein